MIIAGDIKHIADSLERIAKALETANKRWVKA